MYDEFCNDFCVWFLVLFDKGDLVLMIFIDIFVVLDVCVGVLFFYVLLMNIR